VLPLVLSATTSPLIIGIVTVSYGTCDGIGLSRFFGHPQSENTRIWGYSSIGSHHRDTGVPLISSSPSHRPAFHPSRGTHFGPCSLPEEGMTYPLGHLGTPHPGGLAALGFPSSWANPGSSPPSWRHPGDCQESTRHSSGGSNPR
jgi:hypothetical protein